MLVVLTMGGLRIHKQGWHHDFSTSEVSSDQTTLAHEPRAAENDVTVTVTAVITPTSSGLPVFEMIDPATNLEEDDTAEILRNRLRGLVHQLELCWSDDRVILTGVCHPITPNSLSRR